MKRTYASHILIVFFSIAICLTFLMGTSRAFAAPQPAQALPASATPDSTPITDEPVAPDLALTPSATPYDGLASADTTGIIALAILLVVIVIFGVLWGGRSIPRASRGEK
jgi:uncharacterized membrane protein